ncbi:YiiX/YebB-like N1pC/P60 family cysteine hydrolase, partial [Vibrio cholerae]
CLSFVVVRCQPLRRALVFINQWNKMKYLLDLEKLEHADIVLESGNTKLVSDLIKAVTNSHYSHAMLYVGHSLNHATSDGGVFSKNPQRILVDDVKDLKVLRLKDAITDDVKLAICKESSYLVGTLYGKREATKSITKTEKASKSRKQFCSRLVAQCYAKSGINLVSNPDYCTPEDLNRSELLVEVADCVRLATEDDLEIYNRKDPNIENQRETYKWLNNARDLYKKEGVEIQTINDVTKALMQDRKFDNRLCKLAKATKYFDLYNVDRQVNTMRYCQDGFYAVLSNSKDMNKIIREEIALNDREVKRHSENLIAARHNFKQARLKFSKLHIKLYENILNETLHRFIVIKQALTRCGSNTYHVQQKITSLESLLKNKN